MCTTTTHWATHISEECSLGGSGICDGFCLSHGDECTCSCHTTDSLPETTEGVRQWHDDSEGVVASYDVGHRDVGEVWYEAERQAKRMNDFHDLKQFKVMMGQERVIVVERYV